MSGADMLSIVRRWPGRAAAGTWFAALVLAGTGAGAAGQTLADFESAARAGGSAALQLAREDALLERHRLDAAEATRGARLTAGAGLAATREPVTDTVVRDYRRGSVVVGARWPLLDGADLQHRDEALARGRAEGAEARAVAAEDDAVEQVRLAWVDAARAAERQRLAEAFLSGEADVTPRLVRRVRDGALLDADRQAFRSMFETARRDVVRQRVAHQEAVGRLARWSGLPAARPEGGVPRWNVQCFDADRVAAADGSGRGRAGEVGAAAATLAARESVAGRQRWAGVDAGVSVTQSLVRDLGDSSGRSTGIAVDVSVPLGWRALRSAREAEARAEVRRAELQLAAARDAQRGAFEQALAEWRVREADRDALVQRVDAAREALRIAGLRLGRLDGEVLERLLQARYALYGAAGDASEALQRLERAQARLLTLAPPCEGPVAAVDPPDWQTLPVQLAAALPARPATGPRYAWFAWRAEPWLRDPEATLATLPAGTTRLLLGSDARELESYARPEGRASLQRLLDLAGRRGIAVELLLGDPDWALTEGREALLALLRPIAGLPFAGLQLDLERSQLPTAQQPRWDREVPDTLAAVRRLVPWPLALVSHDRDLLDTRFLARLASAGVAELVPMIYVSHAERAAERARRVMAAAAAVPLPAGGRLRVTVAQSIEPVLEPASSLWRAGREGARERWRRLDRLLAAEPGYAGIAVQSYEDYVAAAP